VSDENGATGDDSTTKVNRIVPKLVITLEEDREEFRAFSKPNQWALMQNAEAIKSGNPTDNMASTYKLAMTSIIPSERPRFEEFMMAHGQDELLEEKLTDALLALWNGETMLPLDSTSSDLSGSTGETGSTSEDDSSEPESLPKPRSLGPSLVPVNGSSIPA
jgi:hypothetical protein